jgi:hypothetical protein
MPATRRSSAGKTPRSKSNKKGRGRKNLPQPDLHELDFCVRRFSRLPATTATAAAITSAATAAAAPSALCLGTSLVYVQRTPAQLHAVQSRDSFLAVFGIRHFDKTKTTGTPGVAIGHDRDALYWSILFKQLAQFVFPRIEIQIPNEDILQSGCLGQVSYLNAVCLRGYATDSEAGGVSWSTGEQFKRGQSIAGLALAAA